MKRNITLLAWFNFFCDFRLYAPLAILYFSKVSGSFATGMSIFSVTMLSQSLFEIPTGMYSDLIGRKRTMILGAIASTVAVVCYAIGGSYTWLFLGAVLEGLGRSFYSGNNNALLMDTLKETGKANLFSHYDGKISSSFQIALGLAGFLGGAIASISSLRLIIWLSVIPQFATFVISLFIHEPKVLTPNQGNMYAHLWRSLRLFWEKPALRKMSIINSIGYAVGESGYQFRAAFISLFWPVWAIGFISTFANLGAAVSFYFAGKVIARFKELPILIYSGIYNRVTTLVALLLPSWFSPILMSSSSLLYGVESVAETTLLQREYTDQERATCGSITSLFGSFLFAIVAVLLGLTADKLGTINALLVLQIPMVVTVFLTWNLFRSNQQSV